MQVQDDARWVRLLVGLFALSRLVFYGQGIAFDLSPIDTSWHILDPVLLREDLLRNVFFTPGQPPLYNLMLGAVLKLSDDPALVAAALRALYGAMSLASCLLLFRLARGLAVPAWLAFVVSTLFMLSPALVLYENIPYYSVQVLLLVTSIGVLFQRALSRPGLRPLLALFLTMTVLVYTRSMFQLPWFCALLAFCLLVMPGRRRQVLLAAAAPLALVLALYTKNALVTGHFATSSWLGLSAVKLSVHQLPLDLRERLVAEGALSSLALRDSTFDPPETLDAYFARTPRTGIPVLDRPFKSTKHANYHHLAYVAVSDDLLRDSLYVMRHDPGVYLRSVGEAFLMFMRPASDYPYLRPNRDAIEPWSRLYARFIAGQPRYPREPWFVREPGTMGTLLWAGYLLCVVQGLWAAARLLRGRGNGVDASLVFMWLTVMYVTLVGCAFETGENQRFRFSLHPLLIASLALLASRLYGYCRQRLGQRRSDAPPQCSDTI